MSRDFDSEIELHIAEIEKLKIQMEQTRLNFISEVVVFVKNWYTEAAKTKISNNPDLANDLGIETLKALKEDVTKLIENTSEVVDEFLTEETLWWNKKENSIIYKTYGNRYDTQIEKQLRLILGRLAEPLGKYGFIKTKPDSYYYKNYIDDVWIEFDSTSNSYKHNGRLYYPYGINYSNEMNSLMKQYANYWEEAKKYKEKIEKLKREKAVTSTADLWDTL
ncbi:hypothetical protein [Brevibacillus laterosporus]|uniref:hypothetical protein n=1 Tax=Brevibacillus laterosporus TaxID=1465 RepID=UPI002E2024F5|nr:hypothetical protein [Brevibacillus laterosporus]MED1667177.1 hypothetical protein [Brevibacillus laterosporus]MED1719755.1 hypothetical protein [Brevibacillus laterosporus]